MKYKTIPKQKGPLSTFWHYKTSLFFGFVRLFYRESSMSSKSPPSFFDILQQNGCLKIPKGRPSCIFRHYETAQTSQAVPFVPARYIRSFHVLSEVIYVLLRRKRRIEKSFAFVSARYIRTSEAFSEHERHPLDFLKPFSEFFITCIFLILRFLRFRYSADFRRSRLVRKCFSFQCYWSVHPHVESVHEYLENAGHGWRSKEVK